MNITYNKDKLNYTINKLLIREVYGCIMENLALKTTFGTRPLLAMMLHTGTKNTAIKRAKCLIDRCLVSVYRRKMIRMKDHVRHRALLSRQTAKHHHITDPSTHSPLQKTHNPIHPTRKVRWINKRCISKLQNENIYKRNETVKLQHAGV